jgi:transcriptional regulator with XRE-family HTH domain
MNEKERVWKNLGKELKVLRTRVKESLAEASGAVEIDVKQLASYELGQARPTEDVLMLLISHFNAKDEEAVRLWELAGYGNAGGMPAQALEINVNTTEPADNKIIFTDVVDVTVNNYGVVMNFMQGAGPGKDPNSIARVGMSREHAKSVLQILQLTLTQTEVKNHTNQSTNHPETKNS